MFDRYEKIVINKKEKIVSIKLINSDKSIILDNLDKEKFKDVVKIYDNLVDLEVQQDYLFLNMLEKLGLEKVGECKNGLCANA